MRRRSRVERTWRGIVTSRSSTDQPKRRPESDFLRWRRAGVATRRIRGFAIERPHRRVRREFPRSERNGARHRAASLAPARPASRRRTPPGVANDRHSGVSWTVRPRPHASGLARYDAPPTVTSSIGGNRQKSSSRRRGARGVPAGVAAGCPSPLNSGRRPGLRSAFPRGPPPTPDPRCRPGSAAGRVVPAPASSDRPAISIAVCGQRSPERGRPRGHHRGHGILLKSHWRNE